jgi:hypothetical protein
MNLKDLEKHERNAFGGLVRMMLRADGDFTEAEEARVNEIGEALGGAELIWRVISDSAQAFPKDEQIRASAKAVTRPEARALIRDALSRISASDGVDPSERELTAWLEREWS